MLEESSDHITIATSFKLTPESLSQETKRNKNHNDFPSANPTPKTSSINFNIHKIISLSYTNSSSFISTASSFSKKREKNTTSPPPYRFREESDNPLQYQTHKLQTPLLKKIITHFLQKALGIKTKKLTPKIFIFSS